MFAKTKKIKKAKKIPKAKMLRILDTKARSLWSLAIRERDHYRCFTCGTKGQPKDGKMQCGHLITSAKLSTRFDPLNMHCQCSKCNWLHEMRPETYFSAFVEKYGPEALTSLTLKSNGYQKKTAEFLENAIAEARELLIKLEEVKP